MHSTQNLCFHSFFAQFSASETLEGVFLFNNSMDIQHTTLKPSAMCFYWPVWRFNFLTFLNFWGYHDLLLSTGELKSNFPWVVSTQYLTKKLPYFGSPYPKLKMVLCKKPPLKISFLLSMWILIQVKMQILLKKVTQVILHCGTNHGLSMSHFYWVI